VALNGETIWWADAWVGQSSFTATWTVDFPPAAVMAKVSPAFYMEYFGDDVGMWGTEIASIRRRLPSGADETVSASNNPAIFDPNMTSVTFALFLYNCQARIVLDLGFWS
jgi:hypothetical protein